MGIILQDWEQKFGNPNVKLTILKKQTIPVNIH
jgi:hypothetical protein